jgi:crossover junction endodeoxyribonuclease RuvC
MIVLGVDPGTRITGYGVINEKNNKIEVLDFGCIRPPAKKTLSERYWIIFEGLCNLIEIFSPHSISVETQFVFKNPQTALKLGMARGTALIAAAKYNLPVFEYSPTKAKSSVVGNGRASKKQVQLMVQKLLHLPIPPSPEDAADALALAICHLHTSKIKTLITK